MTFLASPTIALLLRTTFLLGVALLAVRLLRRRGPAIQTVAGRAALSAIALLLLTAPLTRFVPPLWHIPTPAPRPAAPVVRLMPAPLPLEVGSEGASWERAGTSPALTVSAPCPSPNPSLRKDPAKQGGRSLLLPSEGGIRGGLLRLWAAGTALLLLWLAVCQWQLTRLQRRAVPLTNGPAFDTLAALTPHPPCLLACPNLPGPFLAGLVRPAIYLPADHAATFSPDALRAVLAHELAHANRHDTRWTLAARLLCALLWPQPLLWLLCRRLEQLSEDACDRAVLAHACPPRVYADCLLSLAERRPLPRPQRALVQGLVPFRSQLARRIQHILTAKGDLPMPAVTPRLRLAIAAATLLAALSGTLLVAAPAPSKLALWQPISADPTSPLVGVWLFKSQPISGGLDALVIYRANGQEEFIAPGTDGHEANHSYFDYRVSGNELTEQMKNQGSNNPPTVLHFDIIKNRLTIHDALEDSTGERVADDAQASLVQKMLTETDAKPGVIFMRGRSPLIPSDPPILRTFMINFRVPRQGVHHMQFFVKDETGQRLLFDKIGKPGTNIAVPLTATGESVTFHLYDNGKLIQTPSKAIKGRSNAATNDVANALLAKRSQLVSQLLDTEAHVETVKIMLREMRQQFQKRRAEITPPQPPAARTPVETLNTKSSPPGAGVKPQIAAAQNPLLEKQQFVAAVYDYGSRWIKSYNQEADAEGGIRRSLAKYENKQRHLQKEIVALDAQIANVRARTRRG